ncbi:hypothetical protein D8Y22_21755 [Salinadaptatus halalkaliphilus]|uniref:Uncharacterized protein n=1 Tax=Salinadaptatus halalkaliphilus TaxID=2419781 RepID=A0A4V3VKU2_9EURY|nr:hypothetical protein D8Y22_21755 [Salinadaptatus halalkaliphilus]
MGARIPSYFMPFLAVVFLMAVIAAYWSLYILFSFTSLLVLLLLAAVIAASYAGAMMALETFFNQSGQKR